jgi:hypothetical protein
MSLPFPPYYRYLLAVPLEPFAQRPRSPARRVYGLIWSSVVAGQVNLDVSRSHSNDSNAE